MESYKLEHDGKIKKKYILVYGEITPFYLLSFSCSYNKTTGDSVTRSLYRMIDKY